MSAQEADRIFTVAEAAAVLGRCVAMVRRYCADKQLPAELKGKTYVIRAADLAAFTRPDRGWTRGKRRSH